MPGSLGEKLGEGATADVHAWAPGQVVKLSKAGVPQWFGWWEARMIRAVFAASGPAPEVFGEVAVDGRCGIVLPRFEGPTLGQLSRSGAMTPAQTGAILADLAMSVHQTPPPPEVPLLRDRMSASLRLSGSIVPGHIATGITTYLERLAPGDVLCHGDVHPGNVIMTEDGPRIVDWLCATRAPVGFELATSQVLLSEFVPEMVADPERPRAYSAAMQSEYARRVGMSDAERLMAMEPYLPIARVFLIMGGTWPAQRACMIERIEGRLR